MMNEYTVTLTGKYEKTITVQAKTAVQAREKIETILFDTELISFDDEDFVGGEVDISDACEDDCDKILKEIAESLAAIGVAEF